MAPPPLPGIVLPNQVVIGPRLTTAGQPSLEQLRQLRAHGYDVVLHVTSQLSPRGVDAEASVVAAQGIRYVRVGVDSRALTEEDQRLVSRSLDGASTQKVLVRCDLNLLASALVFVYRVADRGEDLQRARVELELAGVPRGPVLQFIEQRLSAVGLSFEPV